MMSRSVRATIALAIVALPASAIAEVAEKPCLQPAEAEALMMFILPGAFDALTDRCRASLPADAPLSRIGHALALRYRPESESAWPLAKAAFGKVSDPAAIKILGDDTLKKLVSTGIANELPKSVKPKDCGLVDRFVAALEPLPARNMALLMGALIEVGSRTGAGDQRGSPFKICPAADIVSAPSAISNSKK